MIKKLRGALQKTESPFKVEYITVGILGIVMFFCFLYGDIMATLEHSMNFLNALFSGKVLDFYQIAIDNSRYGHPAVYDLPIYIVFSIWNLPSYIFSKVAQVSVLDSVVCLLWAKLLIVFFAGLSIVGIVKIGRELSFEDEKLKWLPFVYATSPMLLIPVLLIAQYDIISLCFVLWGVLEYLRGNYKKFLLWFALANTMKLFAVFVFIPLLVYKEKRIWKMFVDLLMGIGGVVFFKLLYVGNAAYKSSVTRFSEDMMDRLMAMGISFSFGNGIFPLFLAGMMGICIYLYVKECKDEKQRKDMAIYIVFVVYGFFVSFVQINLYWMILAVPFTVLMIFNNFEHFKVNMLLDGAWSIGLILILAISNYWVLGKSTISELLLGKIISSNRNTKYSCIYDILVHYNIGRYINFINALIIVCFLSLLVINFPKGKNSVKQGKIERGVIWFRICITGVIAFLMIVVYILPGENSIYNSSVTSNVMYSDDIINGENNIKEEICFEKDVTVNKIIFFIKSEGFTWIDSSILQISLLDEQGEKILAKEYPVNVIKGNQFVIKTGKLNLEAQEKYILQIKGVNSEGIGAYLLINGDKNEFETTQAGIKLDGDICLNIIGKYR